MKRRFFCFLLALLMAASLPVAALADTGHQAGLCPHHSIHTPECSTMEIACVHTHDKSCYPEMTADDTPTGEATACIHECTVRSGCVKPTGPCSYVCQECPAETCHHRRKGDCPVCAVEEKIHGLPNSQSMLEMDNDAKNKLYEEVLAVTEAYFALTVDEQSAVSNANHLIALNLAFSTLTQPLPNLIASGNWGDQIQWTLEDSGMLTVSGTGPIPDDAVVPSEYQLLITKALIHEGITAIGTGTFDSCAALEAVSLPQTLTAIGDYAFFSCSSLTFLTIPEGVTAIGANAFSLCLNLQRISLPSSLTTIGPAAFSCTGLTSVVIPEGITELPENAFSECASLESVQLPKGLTAIGGNAFLYSGLKSIQIPEGVTTIGGSAFYNCTALETVILPQSLTEIGSGAFICAGLKTVTIPKNVTQIHDSAFGSCPALKTVYFSGDAPTLAPDVFVSSDLTAYCPKGNPTWTEEVRQDYYGEVVWKTHAHRFDKKVTQPQHLHQDVKCLEPSVYYFSCLCGENGEKTFTSGKAAGHTGGTATYDAPALCDRCGASYGEKLTLQGIAIFHDGADVTKATLPYDLGDGDQLTLSCQSLPVGADLKILWTCTPASTATIDETGTLTFLKPGTVTVKAATREAPVKTATVKIAASYRAREITITAPFEEVYNGKSMDFTLSILPENASNKKVVWSVDNPDAAYISPKGRLTAKDVYEPTVTIVTASIEDDPEVTASFPVVIRSDLLAIYVDGVNQTGQTIPCTFGSQFTLTAFTNGMPETVVWTLPKSGVTQEGDVFTFSGTTGFLKLTAIASDGRRAKITFKVSK